MMTNIHFHTTKGDTQYIAEGVEIAIVTQAYHLDDLMKNIKEATELYFEDEDKTPDILVEMNLNELEYA
jgi:predicted RNase H-like HicB family nuclease